MWWDDLGDRGLPREADMQALRLAHVGNPGRLEQTEEGPLPASQRDLFDAGDGGDDGPDVWPLCECGFCRRDSEPRRGHLRHRRRSSDHSARCAPTAVHGLVQ